MMLAGLVTLIVLAWPGDAHAWGPITHLVHGSNVLADLSILTSPLRDLLATHRLPYLYGCIAADIFHAKKYTRSLYTHCHCWPVGWQIVEAANGEREEAFAYGYLSHLAADVYSHNHFVPVQLVTSFEARTLRHIYWEARFDAAQERDRWRLVRTVLRHRYRDLDRLVERVVERTLFSFRTNKRIFNSVMALQQLEQWQGMVRRLSSRSRYALPPTEVDRFNDVCLTAIRDLLVRGKRSKCQHADPTGRDALDRAEALRRKLRALARRGQMTEAIAAEVRALAPAAA
jgi:zinc dependent phospholipase C